MPGWDVQVLDDTTGSPAGPNTLGQLVVKLPLPPCAFTTLFRDDERFESSYLSDYPGFYNTGDAGHIDEEGYVSVMTRTDDIINVAGHRLSTGAMEQILSQHPAIAECAVIGIADELKGLVPLGLVVLKQTSIGDDPAQIATELVAMVREQIGPVSAFKKALVVKVLPKVVVLLTVLHCMHLCSACRWSDTAPMNTTLVLSFHFFGGGSHVRSSPGRYSARR